MFNAFVSIVIVTFLQLKVSRYFLSLKLVEYSN